MKLLLIFTFIVAAVTVGVERSFAYTIPENDSKIEYLYVTGPEGDPLTGAEDHKQVLHIDVPENEQDEVVIGIFDPDTSGNIDARPSGYNPWNTNTEITVSGGDGEIYKKVFKGSKYDNEFYYFDSLTVTDGEKIGSFYRFTVEITATTGGDTNLFKVDVSPNSAKVSSPNITFRLLPEEGSKMYFYPLIPADTKQIIVENYDLDHDGGISSLYDPGTDENFEINDSKSGQWQDTVVTFSSEVHTNERFLDYIITKGTQYEAHAGLRIKDADGNPIPIYFRKQDMGGCNEFTFDATSSFDPDNQALTYSWDFGDGNISEEPIVTHRYESGGEYNVILSVQDSSGLDCDTAVSSQVVTVNTPPVADLTGPNTACTSQEVSFDASGSTDSEQSQITYQWDFGDGTSAEGAQVTKAFERGGKYNVLLTVNDNANTTCSIDSIGKVITINTRPVANAGDDIDLCLEHNQDYNVSFNGSSSVDEDGDLLSYRWDFGDGSEDNGVNMTHLYQSRGEYVVTLFVDDGSGTACSSSSDTVNVKLNKAPVAVAGNDVKVCQGTPVTFDGSGSIGEEGEELQYEWDLGDGTTLSGVNVTHTYEKGGNYEVVLTVNDMQNTNCSISMDSLYVTVNSRPTAVLNTARIACTGDEISFDASGTDDADGDDLTYTWDFGDGTSGQGANVTHAYNKGGNYSVRLTVDDNKGTLCSEDLADTNVRVNTPPVADAGPNLVCCLDTVTEFDGSKSFDADGDNLTYTWDFGDGSTGEGAQVTHVYTTIGKFLVTLTVNDNSGTSCDTATDSFDAVVNAKPTSIIKIR